ncbi:MAG TPA: PQQ-binding-like beta-propeller repeat protein [Pyrinomonadaceae bacterium]|nr:PQQ-binding-like beta-propeller repeat protein [Pyrinomonadaceae bacterium]
MRQTKSARRTILLTTVLLAFALAACAARATEQPAARASDTGNAADSGRPAQAAAQPAPAAATPAPTGAEAASVAAGEVGGKVSAPAVAAAEWPQWRGPNRDGLVNGVNAPAAWPKELKQNWRVTVGVGHSSPVVSGGRIYQFARQGEDEVLVALDVVTGKELWRSAGVAAPYTVNPAASGHGKGPKSTPVVASGRVYTLGIAGLLSAHDAKTGRLVWRKDFSKQFPATSPLYGTSMSPVVLGDLLVAHVGGHDGGSLTAFDAATGAVKWSYGADGPAYASPVVMTIAGERQVVAFTQKELVSVSAATGALLWKLPAKTEYDTNCNTPVVYKDTFVVTLEGQGVVAFRPVREGGRWAAREVWRNEENELYMNTPVLHGSTLYGLSARKKGQFFALDAATGKTLWQGPGRMGENASIINVAGTLLALTNDAVLYVLPTGAGSFAPAAQYTVATSPTWAHPVFLGDQILVKDETTLASLSLRQ